MPGSHRLSAKQVEAFVNAGLSDSKKKEKLTDGDGLVLIKRASGSTWFLIFHFNGRRREMSLGKYPVLTLASARIEALDAKRLLLQDINPIDARERQSQKVATFGDVADEYIRRNSKLWAKKTAHQWQRNLEELCKPIRNIPVNEIRHQHIAPILIPYWASKMETANKLHRHIRTVLDEAIADELIDGRNPSDLKGPLKKFLPPRPRKEVKHHTSLSYEEIPSFMERLNDRRGLTADALRLVILTCLRSDELRGARWEEFDWDRNIWTLPGRRMKAKRPHRVPLSKQAVRIFSSLKENAQDQYVFPGQGGAKYLSDMALWSMVRKMGFDKMSTVHGFRTSFRTWAAEQTKFDGNMAEMALAHQVGTEVERAYQRSDMLQRRFHLMQAWADHCHGRKFNHLVSEADYADTPA
jgi:integrase